MARRKTQTETQVDLYEDKDFALELDPELAKLVDPLLARQARAVGAIGGWPFISTQGGIFSRGEAQLETFDAIVLAHARMNSYYKGIYDPNRRESPDCFAIQGLEQTEMEMAPPVELPNKQAEKCFGCRQNEFGSDLRGRGKACKNIHVLALLPLENGLPRADEIARLPGLRLRIPPTSQQWAKVVDRFTSKGVPVCFARIRFGIQDDEKTQFQILPMPLKPLIRDPDLQRAIFARIEEASAQIRQLPPVRAALPAGQKRAASTGTRAPVVRRRSAK